MKSSQKFCSFLIPKILLIECHYWLNEIALCCISQAKGGITSSCGKPSPTVLTVYQSLL